MRRGCRGGVWITFFVEIEAPDGQKNEEKVVVDGEAMTSSQTETKIKHTPDGHDPTYQVRCRCGE